MSNMTRYTLLLDDGAVKSVDRLQKTYGLKNRAEVYDLAVRVLSWMTDQTVKGHEVGRSADKIFQPLLMPYQPNRETWEAN